MSTVKSQMMYRQGPSKGQKLCFPVTFVSAYGMYLRMLIKEFSSVNLKNGHMKGYIIPTPCNLFEYEALIRYSPYNLHPDIFEQSGGCVFSQDSIIDVCVVRPDIISVLRCNLKYWLRILPTP